MGNWPISRPWEQQPQAAETARDRNLQQLKEAAEKLDRMAPEQVRPQGCTAGGAMASLLQDRRQTHGAFTDHARLTQGLKRTMHLGKNWDTIPEDMKEALEMIQHKIGRILSGDPACQDHWADIEGYARLVSQRLLGSGQNQTAGLGRSPLPPSPLPPLR